MCSEIINIKWTGPLKLSDVLADKSGEHEGIFKGIFQVYGHHASYGPDSLLVIDYRFDRTLPAHLRAEAFEAVADHDGLLTVYLGQVTSAPPVADDPSLRKCVHRACRLLEVSHRPANNMFRLRARGFVFELDEAEELKSVHVLNWGDRGKLAPEVSGARWTWLSRAVYGEGTSV